MRPVLDAWVQMIATARAAGVPVIYTTPVSRADGADVVMLPTDLSAETGVPPLTNAVEGRPEASLALDHRLDELTHPVAQTGFNRIKPIVEKMDRRLGVRL
jgi:hypothetical protein